MPAPATNSAALVPLDFTSDRQELSLIFVSTDWADIVPLMHKPNAFFQSRAGYWQHPFNPSGPKLPGYHEWDSHHSPILSLEWVGKSFQTLRRAKAIFKQFVVDNHITAAEFASIAQPPTSNPRDVANSIGAVFPTGLIIAEFALKTRTIAIRYQPPATRSPLRYKGPITSTTMVKLLTLDQDIDGKGIDFAASLHFDLDTSELGRALFLADYLEDWAGTTNRALALDPTHFKIADAGPSARGELLSFGQTSTKSAPTCMTKLPSADDATEVLYPAVTMETPPLDMVTSQPPEGSTVCVQSNGVWTPANPGDIDLGFFTVNGTTAKYYFPQPGP